MVVYNSHDHLCLLKWGCPDPVSCDTKYILRVWEWEWKIWKTGLAADAVCSNQNLTPSRFWFGIMGMTMRLWESPVITKSSLLSSEKGNFLSVVILTTAPVLLNIPRKNPKFTSSSSAKTRPFMKVDYLSPEFFGSSCQTRSDLLSMGTRMKERGDD